MQKIVIAMEHSEFYSFDEKLDRNVLTIKIEKLTIMVAMIVKYRLYNYNDNDYVTFYSCIMNFKAIFLDSSKMKMGGSH